MITRRVISLAVMGIFLVLGSVSTSKTLQPLWHFKIDDMIHFAMSANGKYIIATCEKGPLCDEGQYYIFDQYGNTVTHGCIESEITVVDIADNGAFFIGTRTGYYFRTGSGKIQKDLDMGILFQSVSISENGQVVAGTDKEIFIFDEYGNQTKKEVGKPILNTAISASGNMAIAGSRDRIFLYKKSTDSWEDHPTVAKPVGLAISDNEQVVVCGNGSGIVWIFDSDLRVQEEIFSLPGGLDSMALSGDGEYLVCGSSTNKIIYFDTSGNEIWSSDIDGTIKDIAVSFDGDLVTVLSDNITFFDFKGKKIQELKSQNIIHYMQLSKFEKFLSYALNDELKFFDLYQQSYVDITTYMDTSEYPPPSRKSIPLDDELIEEWSYGSTPYKVAVEDVNQDGDNEIVCSFSNELIVLNSEGRALWKESFSFEPLFFILDVTGDLVPEILVKSDDNRMEIQVFNGNGTKLASHEFYSQWYPTPPSKERGGIGIFPLWSGNIDDDDSIEVICKLHAGYILKPRGLYAFEYPSFEKEWSYPVGPNLMT